MNSINCNGKILDLSTPVVMGILNCTPDSFYEGGIGNSPEIYLKRVTGMVGDGVDIIDIGGMSTRPGADPVSPKEELKRILPVIEMTRKEFPGVVISVDTFRADVAEAAYQSGADMINDISGGELDRGMMSFIAESKLPYVLMHMKGTPKNMQNNPQYDDPVNEIFHFFLTKIKTFGQSGIHDLIIDPGFGFGKSLDHNFELLKKLEVFTILDKPILAGISRKSMLYKTIEGGPEDALCATCAMNMVALQNGAKILRVHDVKEAKDVIRLWSALKAVR